MFIEKLNLNELRIFASVFESLSMTVSARELHLTQSGVSQHIAALEKALSVRLFDRLKRRLYPTPAARDLYAACRQGFETLETTLQKVRGQESNLAGTIKLGMPSEFGASLVAPWLGAFASQHPFLRFDLRFEYSDQVLSELVSGDLDMAFVDEFSRHPGVTIEPVYREALDLCVAEDLLKGFGKGRHEKAFYESLPFVDYESGNPLSLGWMKHHLKGSNVKLDFRAFAPSVQGVTNLVVGGMGCGILPRRISSRLEKEGLHVFRRREPPWVNSIGLALLSGRTQGRAVTELSIWLKERLKRVSA